MVDAFIILINISCLFLVALLLLYWLLVPIFTAPFYASNSEDIIKMFELADLSNKDKAVDLGSGDGRVALAASRVAREAVGIDINPFLTLLSRFIALFSTNGSVKFKHKDMFSENLSEYDVVFMYLMPGLMKKLEKKFERELAPGTRIVSKSFRLKGWKPKKVVEDKFYLYVVGKHR